MNPICPARCPSFVRLGVVSVSPIAVALLHAVPCHAGKDVPVLPDETWMLVWVAIVLVVIVLSFLWQNRLVKRKTRELRRELFERQMAEKELLESQHNLRRSLAEKEALLKEVHHRVKNNLQIISSLLYLQEEYMSDPKGVDILRQSQNRVKSMALIHEQLYSTSDLARIDFGRYVEGLTANLQDAYGIDPMRIQFDIQADQIALGVDMAVPCGLMINELVSNAVKHAFAPDAGGRIEVVIRHRPADRMEIKVADNGVGLPPMPADEKPQSLGLRLIDTLVTQLEGSLTMDTKNGAAFSILLKLPEGSRKESQI